MKNQLQKKCVVGSSLVHGGLILIFLLSAAFSSEKTPIPEFVTVVDPRAIPTDGLSTGGSPAPEVPNQPKVATPTPPPPPVVQPKPVEPPQVEPTPVVEVKPTPVPTKVEESLLDKFMDKISMKDSHTPEFSVKPPVKPETKPKPQKQQHVIKPTFAPIDPKNHQKDLDREKLEKEIANRRRADKEAKARLAQYNELTSTIRDTGSEASSKISSGTGKATEVKIIGSGGGQAFANFSDLVYTIYNNAWYTPQGVSEDVSVVVAEVTIGRDGRVVSSEIVKKSGISKLDQSVQNALDRVKRVNGFPQDSSDDQRTFSITFNLFKRLHG